MDKYTIAIRYFMSLTPSGRDDALRMAWYFPETEKGGCLFDLASRGKDKYSITTASGAVFDVGCLTQIRASNGYAAITEELAELIRADKKIPSRRRSVINKANGQRRTDASLKRILQQFAYWQRRVDKIAQER